MGEQFTFSDELRKDVIEHLCAAYEDMDVYNIVEDMVMNGFTGLIHMNTNDLLGELELFHGVVLKDAVPEDFVGHQTSGDYGNPLLERVARAIQDHKFETTVLREET
jgi:hypothetical protein